VLIKGLLRKQEGGRQEKFLRVATDGGGLSALETIRAGKTSDSNQPEWGLFHCEKMEPLKAEYAGGTKAGTGGWRKGTFGEKS